MAARLLTSIRVSGFLRQACTCNIREMSASGFRYYPVFRASSWDARNYSVDNSNAATQSRTSTKKRRKLPPTINVTEGAAKIISKLLQKNPNVAGVKVSHDGVTYAVTYVSEGDVHTLDETIKHGDATVIVDWKSFGALVGKVLDFDDEKRNFAVIEKSSET
eukprot:jgi/Bigna1/88103/estExt_fgenesh1_pg.C_280069